MFFLPPEVIVKISLNPGSAFLYSDDEFPEKKHFFVVVNNKINDDTTELVLACASSQVEKRVEWVKRRGFELSTLIIIDPDECEFLTKQTVFDCNSLLVRPKEYIVEKISSGSISKIAKVEEDLLRKLQEAIQKSRMVTARVKKLVSA